MFSFKDKEYEPNAESYFDQSKYFGRMFHFMAVTSPTYPVLFDRQKFLLLEQNDPRVLQEVGRLQRGQAEEGRNRRRDALEVSLR